MAFDGQNDFDFDDKVLTRHVKEAKAKAPGNANGLASKKRGPKKAFLSQFTTNETNENEDVPLMQTADPEVVQIDSAPFTSEESVPNVPNEAIVPNVVQQESKMIPSSETKKIPLSYDKYRCSWIAKRKSGHPARLSKTFLEWPTSSSTCCWWCCHSFDTTPVPLPYGYNDNIEAFSVKGTFCSWGCAKAYSLGESHTLGYHSQLLLLLRKKVEGKIIPIKCAPHRSQLSMFGGQLSIEAFRRASATECTQSMLTVNMLAQTFGLMMIKNEQQELEQQSSEPSGFSMGRSKLLKPDLGLDNISIKKNEPLKLKRNKPSPASKGKTILERVLGITAE